MPVSANLLVAGDQLANSINWSSSLSLSLSGQFLVQKLPIADTVAA